MKLCYRGVEYDYNPPSLEVTEREILGRYRGRPLRFSYVHHVPFPQPVAELQFRGAAYQTDRLGGRQALAGPSAYALNVTQMAAQNGPMAAARVELLKEAARTHQESIQRSLQHRLSVAQSQGNNYLVQQLEQERHQTV